MYLDAGELYYSNDINETSYIEYLFNYININKDILYINNKEESFNNSLKYNNYTIEMDIYINYKIFNIKLINRNIIKIGIINLLIKKDENYQLEELVKEINIYINILKENGINAIILLTNLEIRCNGKSLKLNMFSNKTQLCDEYSNDNKTIFNVLKHNISIDAVIMSNSYDLEIHHWVNGIPIMSSPSYGKYFNIMYLPFKKEYFKYILNNSKIKIEGPIPICEKIFNDTQKCDSEIPTETGEYIDFYFHDRKMFKDISLKKIENQDNI